MFPLEVPSSCIVILLFVLFLSLSFPLSKILPSSPDEFGNDCVLDGFDMIILPLSPFNEITVLLPAWLVQDKVLKFPAFPVNVFAYK